MRVVDGGQKVAHVLGLVGLEQAVLFVEAVRNAGLAESRPDLVSFGAGAREHEDVARADGLELARLADLQAAVEGATDLFGDAACERGTNLAEAKLAAAHRLDLDQAE